MEQSIRTTWQQASPAVDCSVLGSKTYSVAGLGQNLSHSSMQCFPLSGHQHVCLHSQAKTMVRRLQPCSFIATTQLLQRQQIQYKAAAHKLKDNVSYVSVYCNATLPCVETPKSINEVCLSSPTFCHPCDSMELSPQVMSFYDGHYLGCIVDLISHQRY